MNKYKNNKGSNWYWYWYNLYCIGKCNAFWSISPTLKFELIFKKNYEYGNIHFKYMLKSQR